MALASDFSLKHSPHHSRYPLSTDAAHPSVTSHTRSGSVGAMEAAELLLRGLAALGAMALLVRAARVRFAQKLERDGGHDIGLD